MNCTYCDTPIPEGARFCPACGKDTTDPGSQPRTTTAQGQELFQRLLKAIEGRYEIQDLLGRGGMGAVYLARDISLDRLVAIKVLPTDLAQDENFVGRFRSEAQTAARLDHPGIIPIYSVESDDDLHYFIMKYVQGRSLEDIIEAGRLPFDAVQRILWESACALGHAHQRGVVHRDVKPANIMVDEQGRAMLTDFGISRALQSATRFTATGQVIGTPHYMSPEQSKGDNVDGRSDQYSLAIVGYLLLAGRLPFEDDSVHTVIYKHIFEDPEYLQDLNPEVPDFLATAIHRGLAKEPDDRFQTMEEFASAVWPEHQVTAPSVLPSGAVLRPSSVAEATEVTPMPAASAGKRGKRVAAGLFAVVVLAGAGGAMWLNRDIIFPAGEPAPGRSAAQQSPEAGLPGDSNRADNLVALSGTGGQVDSQAVTQQPAPVTNRKPDRSNPQPQQPARNRPQTPTRRRPPETRPAAKPLRGYLTIQADPWASVFIDGVKVGDTPVWKHELTPGRHIVELRREGYRTIVDTINVTAGNTIGRKRSLVRAGSR